MPTQVLFENAEHRNILLEDFSSGQMVQANQHLILHRGRGILLDPGGHKIYSLLLAELGSVMSTGGLDYLFFSHQDPDIVAAANGWLMMTNARALIPRIWIRFVAHFGVDEAYADRIVPVPDKGMRLDLGGTELLILPAHFLHSPGNFQIYDPVSKILYSGDLGASLGQTYSIVQNFDDHIQYMQGFHQRYIPSGQALKFWAGMVRGLDIQMIAPQHGAILKGPEMVQRFIAWAETLPCGLDLIGGAYQLP